MFNYPNFLILEYLVLIPVGIAKKSKTSEKIAILIIPSYVGNRLQNMWHHQHYDQKKEIRRRGKSMKQVFENCSSYCSKFFFQKNEAVMVVKH